MSDEESFVILGTSPTSSMDTINSLPMASNSPVTKEPIVAGGDLVNGVVKTNGLTVSQLLTSTSSEGSQFSIVQNNDSLALLKMTKAFDEELIADCVSQAPSKILTSSTISKQLIEACENGKPESCHSNGSDNNSMNSTNSAKPEASLAASFILGEVNSDVLKASVYSQFPSICSMSACPEDVVKLQNMMSEYMELKKTLLNTNITMKQLYDQTQKWKADVKAMEDDRRAEIAKLRNENLELRRDLDLKVEQIHINEEARRKEHEEFIQSLSEKTAKIENMSSQIQKLEQQQLTASNQAIEATEGAAAAATEYVTTMEHKRVIKDFERQLSVIVAENLELKDMQQQYIDEINCLKVNLVAAEELQKKSDADIQFLKASDVEKSEMFNKFEAERKSLRIDLDVLTQQLEIYSKDFKTEQESRENLANEKDQLLSDLREMQKKNQELIQEAQKNFEEHTKQVMTQTGAFPKTRTQPVASPRPSIYSPENNFNCPICGKIFKTLCILQTHVNQCLDGN
ncbi:NF-kappa-B essential modulator-like isoform X2 [Episyrphus balteatus]|uniref:NF-kappa-B essential modulator-like isoform X2 n=1 Tax=Episyrphus balteatus TaxID=286459 RepID=UPI0024859296|nr:NF-kappa-B essential modulator-like isoform X2 [Episyrphus balteatus]